MSYARSRVSWVLVQLYVLEISIVEETLSHLKRIARLRLEQLFIRKPVEDALDTHTQVLHTRKATLQNLRNTAASAESNSGFESCLPDHFTDAV